MRKFNLRWAQLDLARQKENLPFIKRFMDLLAQHNYNGVFLYLEDRVATPIYPYAGNECYTAEEIKELVAYGKARNLELIPCVSTLGHAERFLKHAQLHHISELRNNQKGRFGGSKKDAFCVSTPETYDFLFQYIREISELFPSKFFHAGLDEFFNFALCPLCRKKAADHYGREKLFLEHIIKVRNFLATLGKRMMMWSDMLENYCDILEEIPQDVVMVDWQYQTNVRFAQAHFGNLKQQNFMEMCRKRGIDVMIAPADFYIHNGTTYCLYAENQPNVIGCLVTGWEKNDTYCERRFPTYAWLGGVMNGFDRETSFKNMMKNLFDVGDPIFAGAIRQCAINGFMRHFESVSENMLFSENVFGPNFSELESDFLAKTILSEYYGKISEDGKYIVSDLLNGLTEKCLSHTLKRYVLEVLHFGLNEKNEKEICDLSNKFLAYIRNLSSQWELRRSGIEPNYMEIQLPKIEARLKMFAEQLRQGNFIKLRLVAPDNYGAQQLKISLERNGVFEEIASGVYKPANVIDATYEYYLPYSGDASNVTTVKLESWGFGGLGVAYFELRKNGRTVKIPDTVTAVSKLVENPDYIIDNDSKWAFIGTQDLQSAFECEDIANQISSITLTVKDAE